MVKTNNSDAAIFKFEDLETCDLGGGLRPDPNHRGRQTTATPEISRDLFCKISNSIQLIRCHEPSKPYHVALSGGKDSIVSLDLVRSAGVRFQIYTYRTSFDFPEIIDFLNHNYPEATVIRPPRTIYSIIEQYGFPSQRRRKCCYFLKERNGTGRTVITGIRAAESENRAKRHVYEVSTIRKSKFFLHPIHAWSDDNVWEYINHRGLIVPDMYYTGSTRVGCMFCPMSRPDSTSQSIQNYPKHYQALLSAMQKHLDTHPKSYVSDQFERNPEAIFRWVYFNRCSTKPNNHRRIHQ